jgi:acyl-CoA reductase-like NAD-dependent aldehyde dehydrogenase
MVSPVLALKLFGVKQSGTGREGLKYTIEEMTELKLVVFNQN